MPDGCRPGSRPLTIPCSCQYRCICNRQQRPLAGDRPLAVVSNRYTSNGLSICPFSPPSRLIHAGDSICDVPVPGQHLRTAAVFSAPDAHCLVIAPRCQEAAVGTPGHRTYIGTANFSYIGNRQQRPLAGDRGEVVDRTVIPVTVLPIFPLLPRPLCNAGAQLQAYVHRFHRSSLAPWQALS